jgi:hypothetical protein
MNLKSNQGSPVLTDQDIIDSSGLRRSVAIIHSLTPTFHILPIYQPSRLCQRAMPGIKNSFINNPPLKIILYICAQR